jgi:hypothetical protein
MNIKKAKLILLILIVVGVNILCIWGFFSLQNPVNRQNFKEFIRIYNIGPYFLGLGMVLYSAVITYSSCLSFRFIFKSGDVLKLLLNKKPNQPFYKSRGRVIFGGFIFLLESCFILWIAFMTAPLLSKESFLFKVLLTIAMLMGGYYPYSVLNKIYGQKIIANNS